MDFLDLEGWTLTEKRLVDGEFELEAEHAAEPNACSKCGVIGRLHRHGSRMTIYRDSPVRGCKVKLLAKVKRYRCRDCGGTFLQPLAGVLVERHMTQRCAEFIQKQCLMDTFVRVASEVGCDEKTVRSVAKTHIAKIDNGYLPKLPEWMGLDETQIDGRMRCVITDIGGKRPIEMLDARDKDTLSRWFLRFEDRSMVKGIAIDMWRPYQRLAAELFPDVPVVIDKFHVVRLANYCMERVRIRLGKAKTKGLRRYAVRSRHLLNKREAALSEAQRFSRDIWLDNDAEMKAAYDLKEAFYAIYKLPKAQATAAFLAYPATVPVHLRKDFKVLTRAMKNWEKQILAYFDHPISNGYTEALNGVAKAINRAGRGYTFPVLRARLLFKAHAGKPLRPGDRRWPLIRNLPIGVPVGARLLRCESCGGLYHHKIVASQHVPPLVPRQRLRTMRVCRPCHLRFDHHAASSAPEKQPQPPSSKRS